MQYTGLKDKNEKEIYEGDIVYCSQCDSKSVVAWNNLSAMFGFHRPNVHDNYEVDTHLHKVIGNVWEDPELLEGK